MTILECLCNKPNKNEFSKVNEYGELRIGFEHTCKITNGKGSCGEDFFEDGNIPCRWCCQIIKK